MPENGKTKPQIRRALKTKYVAAAYIKNYFGQC